MISYKNVACKQHQTLFKKHTEANEDVCDNCAIVLSGPIGLHHEKYSNDTFHIEDNLHLQSDSLFQYLYDICMNSNISINILFSTYTLYRKVHTKLPVNSIYSKYDIGAICLYKTLQNEDCDFTMREIMAITGINTVKLFKLLKILFPKSPPIQLAPLAERICGYLGISRRDGYKIGKLCATIENDNHPALNIAMTIASHFPNIKTHNIAIECGISIPYFKKMLYKKLKSEKKFYRTKQNKNFT